MNTAPATTPMNVNDTSTKAGDIHRLIPKAMAMIGHIGKDRKNVQQGYQFRGIDDVFFAAQPVFAEIGIFCAPEVLAMHREEGQTKNGGTLHWTVLTIRHRFYAGDASYVDVITVGEGMDSGDKSANKAMSAAYKYAVLELFAIPTQEGGLIDSETDSPQKKSKEELAVEKIEKNMRRVVDMPAATMDDLKKAAPAADCGISDKGMDYLRKVYAELAAKLKKAATPAGTHVEREPGTEG